MKKRIISLILALVIAFGLFPVTARANSIPTGLQYEVLDDHVEITRSLVLFDHIEIPTEIEGKPVTHIQPLAFTGQNTLVSITIPETVTTIGMFAFSGCTNLSTIFFLGGPPQSIEPSAFSGVTATVCCPPDKGSLMEYYNMQDYGGELTWVPHDASHMPDYTITVTDPTCTEQGYITYTFFCDCSSNYVIDYQEPLEHDYTTGVCTRCGDLDHIPDQNLQYIIYDDHVEITGYTGDAEEVLIPTEIDEKPVTVICERAFYGCGRITSVDLPDLLRTIKAEAFTSCSSLTEISIPNHVYDIHDQAFAECFRLTSVFISGSVGFICETAFNNCFSLTRLEVAKNNEHYFNDDRGVLFYTYPPDESNMGDVPCLCLAPDTIAGSYAIPDGTASIGSYAFSSCHSLTDINIPDSVTYISESAFANCTSLTDINVPDSVANILSYAFAGCTNLTSITFNGDAPEFDRYVFSEVTATAYYPADNATWTEDVMQNYGGTITWLPYNPNNPFTDVPVDSFYEEAVLWALENNITTGIAPDTFAPNDQCIRAQVVTFLWRAEGTPEPSLSNVPFTDVAATDFFYKPVLWAVENGITTGLSPTEFGSTSVCNRAQVVTFLWRAAGCPEPQSAENPFTDVTAADFFYKPVLWALENGITTGIAPNEFGANTDCNRAQVVTFLYRAYN